MTPKLFRSDETRQWLRHAREDLTAAEVLTNASPPLLKVALFHCQQAVEKAFKGYLVWHEQSFTKTHNLVALGKQCVALDDTLKPTIVSAVDLTRYAVKFRYPGETREGHFQVGESGVGVPHGLANRRDRGQCFKGRKTLRDDGVAGEGDGEGCIALRVQAREAGQPGCRQQCDSP